MSLNDMLDEEENRQFPWTEEEMVDWINSRPTYYRIKAMSVLREARARGLSVYRLACLAREKYEAEEEELNESQRQPLYVVFSEFMQGWFGIPVRNQ